MPFHSPVPARAPAPRSPPLLEKRSPSPPAQSTLSPLAPEWKGRSPSAAAPRSSFSPAYSDAAHAHALMVSAQGNAYLSMEPLAHLSPAFHYEDEDAWVENESLPEFPAPSEAQRKSLLTREAIATGQPWIDAHIKRDVKTGGAKFDFVLLPGTKNARPGMVVFDGSKKMVLARCRYGPECRSKHCRFDHTA
jgi:hypothetical protein